MIHGSNVISYLVGYDSNPQISKPMQNMNIDRHSRKTVIALLKSFCGFSAKDEAHYIEVVEWVNAEGVDVVMEATSGKESFSLTYGQFDALKACMKELGG